MYINLYKDFFLKGCTKTYRRCSSVWQQQRVALHHASELKPLFLQYWEQYSQTLSSVALQYPLQIPSAPPAINRGLLEFLGASKFQKLWLTHSKFDEFSYWPFYMYMCLQLCQEIRTRGIWNKAIDLMKMIKLL